jgi:class 3 adenylate cyclase
MTERPSGLVTILFTDLVGSTELLSRAGDEEAQRVFRAHHDLLAETATAHGALMYVRRGDRGDPDRARPLLEAARRQFEQIAMTGWIRRSDELMSRMP